MPKRQAEGDVAASVNAIVRSLPSDPYKRSKVVEGLFHHPEVKAALDAGAPSSSKKAKASEPTAKARVETPSQHKKPSGVTKLMQQLMPSKLSARPPPAKSPAPTAPAAAVEPIVSPMSKDSAVKAYEAKPGEFIAVECEDPDYPYYLMLVDRPLRKLTKSVADAYGNKFPANAKVVQGRWLEYAGGKGRRYAVCSGVAYARPGQILMTKVDVKEGGPKGGILVVPQASADKLAAALADRKEKQQQR